MTAWRSCALVPGGKADDSRRDRGRGSGVIGGASWPHHGRRGLVELAGLQSGRCGAPHGTDRGLRLSRAAASPAARLGLSRMSALGTVLVVDAAPPPLQKMAERGSASTLAFEMSDGAQRLSSIVAGPACCRRTFRTNLLRDFAPLPRTARSCFPTRTPPTSVPGGSLGKGVEDVTIDRTEDNDASRLEGATTAMSDPSVWSTSAV